MIGELICELRDGRPYIVHADPVIQATAEFVHWWTQARSPDWCGLPPPAIACSSSDYGTFFTFRGSNIEYIYRLDEYDAATGLWTLRWPD